ncbi:hypothetical protein HG537_0F03550 [Torulaspora globosa]|uniref:t-SNARE coiled-coil homology domain-containing protein n=1 Tax=Torulaspora globosa TaxID=48254 RepID=A0A7H9HV33_9SACH|nr:hypothetical protein HG537_0F03550 [Torulaspora sp. CBS 2947]
MQSAYHDNVLHQRDNNRLRLFDTVVNGQGTSPSSPYESNAKIDYSESSLARLESQNQEEMGVMSQKIKALKSLSLKMGDEIRGSNQTLDSLGDTFQRTSTKVKANLSNMLIMAKNSRISIKTWLIIFFIVGLLFFWVWIR